MLGGTWLQEGQQSVVTLTHTSTADWQSSWAFSLRNILRAHILSGRKNLILFCTFQKQIDTRKDKQIKAERNKGMDDGHKLNATKYFITYKAFQQYTQACWSARGHEGLYREHSLS